MIVEARLAQLSERRACVLTANATTAIYLALAILRERHGSGEVIVPAITCPQVAQAVVYAGLEPVFADVDLPDATISPGSLRALIGERTRAIVPIHIFGHAAPIAEIVALARERRIAVIEDAAQATGGSIDGRPIGSFGEFSVHSFGGTKIANAGGGGALLTDDLEAAARARELARALPPFGGDLADELLALSERNFYHGLTDLLRVEPQAPVGAAFRGLIPHYRGYLLRSLSTDAPLVGRIGAALDGLPANLAHRRALAARYHDGLADLPQIARSEGWRRSAVSWRYTVVLPDPATTLAVTGALRDAGLNASNHYWPVAQLMFDRTLPNAAAFGRRVLNLWVDGSTSEADVERTLGVLHATLAR